MKETLLPYTVSFRLQPIEFKKGIIERLIDWLFPKPIKYPMEFTRNICLLSSNHSAIIKNIRFGTDMTIKTRGAGFFTIILETESGRPIAYYSNHSVWGKPVEAGNFVNFTQLTSILYPSETLRARIVSYGNLRHIGQVYVIYNLECEK